MQREVIGDATLYLGDCLEILPTLPKVDAVITDPPYGVGLEYASHDDRRDGYETWCATWFEACCAVTVGPIAISCGIWNLQMWPRAGWVLCWNKPNSMGRAVTGWNTWEPVLVYGKVRGVRTHDSFSVAVVPQTDTGDHPCPKPVRWGHEVIKRIAAQDDSILDPFMGSGTTGVACAQLDRKFIGIEIEPKYFDIACRRIEQAYAQGQLFEPAMPKQEQASLYAP